MKTSAIIEKSLALMELIGQEGALEAAEIYRRLNVPRSTFYVVINTLMANGYLTRTNFGQYQLGTRIFSIGASMWSRDDLQGRLHPVLEALAKDIGETCHLGVLDRSDYTVVYIDKVDSPQSLRLSSAIGIRNPLYCTAVGKALLAFCPEEIREAYYRQVTFTAFTPKTLSSVEALREEIARTALRGFATQDEEHEIGVRCVAVPLYQASHVLVGAISVAGPVHRLPYDRLEGIAEKIVQATDFLTHQMLTSTFI